MTRKTKIVCTIGPACDNKKTIKEMIKAGMNVARVNMSHGTYESHNKTIKILQEAREEMNSPLAIMLDLKGPEIRIKTFKTGKALLKKGHEFVLTSKQVEGNENIVSISHENLGKYLKIGQKILLNDGYIELQVKAKKSKDVICVVKNGGEISNNKSINIPGVSIPLKFLSDVDKLDLLFGIKQGIDFVALSFVQCKQNVEEVRNFLKSNNALDIKIVSKIESRFCVKNIDEITQVSDGVMVARGDLGVEIDFKKLPHIQKLILEKAQEYGKFSITATQMLESMIKNPRPTRAEISDVSNAIMQKTSAIMLSGETAVGVNPTKCVKVMSDIAKESEKFVNYKKELSLISFKAISISENISFAAVTSSFQPNVKALLVVTWSGKTAQEISRLRPQKRILAGTPNQKTFNQMSVLFGVEPFVMAEEETSDRVFAAARKFVLKNKILNAGDTVVQTAGIPVGATSETNTLKIDTI